MDDFEGWLRNTLFPDDFFNESFFEHGVVLFARPLTHLWVEQLIHAGQAPAPFTRHELYRSIMKVCGVHQLQRNAVWFHVNVHDNCAWVLETWDSHPHPVPNNAPLLQVYYRLQEHRADEGGTTYVGVLGSNKDWLLLFEHANAINISFYGSQAVCNAVKDELNRTSMNS